MLSRFLDRLLSAHIGHACMAFTAFLTYGQGIRCRRVLARDHISFRTYQNILVSALMMCIQSHAHTLILTSTWASTSHVSHAYCDAYCDAGQTAFARRGCSSAVCIKMSDVDKLLAELLSDEDSEVSSRALQAFSCMPSLTEALPML